MDHFFLEGWSKLGYLVEVIICKKQWKLFEGNAEWTFKMFKEIATTAPRSMVSSIRPSWGTMVVIDDHPLIQIIEHRLLFMMAVNLETVYQNERIRISAEKVSCITHYLLSNINKMLLGCPWNLVMLINKPNAQFPFQTHAFRGLCHPWHPASHIQTPTALKLWSAFHSSGGL